MNPRQEPALGPTQRRLLDTLDQPMTASQVAVRMSLGRGACSKAIQRLVRHGLLACLNPTARRSRLYWRTRKGTRDPSMDWDLYAWTCYSHRRAVIKALDVARCPADIKRRARYQDSNLKMSANNVRDVIRLRLQKGLVDRIQARRRSHPRYELTNLGRAIQTLLLAADSPIHHDDPAKDPEHDIE